MTNSTMPAQVASGRARHGRRVASQSIIPADPRNLGELFLASEIDADRRSEWWLIPKTILALAIVAVLVVLREVFFA